MTKNHELGCPKCGGSLTRRSGLVVCRKCGHRRGEQNPASNTGAVDVERHIAGNDESLTRIGDGYDPHGRRRPLDFD